MLISVVIPTYNRKESLLATLRAIDCQNLAPSDFEVIVVSDGSTDGSEEAVRQFSKNVTWRLLLISQANGGPAKARNAGVLRATAPLIAFTDDDCLPDSNWLPEIIGQFKNSSVVGLQGSTYTERDKITPLTHQIDNEKGNKSVPTCNAAYRKAILEQVQGFDEHFPFPHNEDADLAWRITPFGKILFCQQMRVFHPARTDRFSKVAKRMKIMESEFRLYYKNPQAYQDNRASSPWRNIYWEIGVLTQWYYFKSRFKFWRNPVLLVQGVAITCWWWIDLIRLYPTFSKADRYNRSLFQH